MFGSPTLDAVAALAAAAVYYLWPVIAARLGGTRAAEPAQPFLLPVALQQGPGVATAPGPNPQGSIDAFISLLELRAFYLSAGMSVGDVDDLIRPHLSHLFPN